MCAQRNPASASNDVIDLVSDEDEDDTESQQAQALQGLYELASLRTLIPPNFLSQPSSDDFFNKEFAVSLMQVTKNQPCSTEGRTQTILNHPKSNASIFSIRKSSTEKNSNPPKSKTSNSSTLSTASSVVDRNILSENNHGLTNGSKINNSSITIKPVEVPASTHSSFKVLDICSQNRSLIKNVNGVKSNQIPITLNGTRSHSDSSDLNSSSNLHSELAAVKALGNHKTTGPSGPKSLTIRGFTITPAVTKSNNSSDVNPQEIRRKPPPLTYSCNKCHEKFNYNVALLEHLSNVHKVSSEPINISSNSSSHKKDRRKKNKKTEMSETKKNKPKKANTTINTSSPIDDKQNSKGTKVKRKKKSCDDTTAKKPLLNADISPEVSIASNPIASSPEAIQEKQIDADCNSSIPMFETIKRSPTSPLNFDDCLDEVSSTDDLVMDLSEENPSDRPIVDPLCDIEESNVESNSNFNQSRIEEKHLKSSTEFDLDDPIQLEEHIRKRYKFLAYLEVEPKSNEVKTHRCSFCSKGFTGIEAVLDHSERCNGRRQIYCQLPNCTKAGFNPQIYKDHLLVKHNIVTHSCNVCKSYFVQEEELKLHQLSCINCSSSQYQCPVKGCNCAYFFELHFRSHLHRKHKIIEIHTCKVCKLIFENKDDLEVHFKTPAHVTANIERMHKAAELQKKLEKKNAEKR